MATARSVVSLAGQSKDTIPPLTLYECVAMRALPLIRYQATQCRHQDTQSDAVRKSRPSLVVSPMAEMSVLAQAAFHID